MTTPTSKLRPGALLVSGIINVGGALVVLFAMPGHASDERIAAAWAFSSCLSSVSRLWASTINPTWQRTRASPRPLNRRNFRCSFQSAFTNSTVCRRCWYNAWAAAAAMRCRSASTSSSYSLRVTVRPDSGCFAHRARNGQLTQCAGGQR